MATVGRAETLGLAFQHGSPQVDLLRTVAHARYVAAHQSRSIRDRLEGTAARVVHGRGRVTAPGTVLVTTDVGERELDLRPAAPGDRRRTLGAAVRAGRPRPRVHAP